MIGSEGLEAAVLGLVVSGLGGLAVPALIARIPEPADLEPVDPEPVDVVHDEASGDVAGVEPTQVVPPEPKVPYALIAGSRGLGVRCAVVSALVGAALGATLGLDWALLFLLPLVPALVALSVVDWRTRLLPTWLVGRTYVVLVALVLVTSAVSGDHSDLVRAGWGWLIAGATFFLLWFVHPRGLGYGDVRLSGVLGIALGWLGWSELLTGIYAGFLLGGVGGGLLALVGLADRKGVPFGPFMVVGALAGVVLGPWAAAHLVGG